MNELTKAIAMGIGLTAICAVVVSLASRQNLPRYRRAIARPIAPKPNRRWLPASVTIEHMLAYRNN